MSETERQCALSADATSELGMPVPDSFENELSHLINRHGIERFSNTPDWVLARFVVRLLNAYAQTVLVDVANKQIAELGMEAKR